MTTPEATPWKTHEENLLREADSLGELLEQLYERAFPRLIDAPAWGRIVTCARELPVTMAALPFGFEVRLHDDPDPRADLGVLVAKGTHTETFFRERASVEDADSPAAGIVRFLDKTGQTDAPLRLDGLGLEYDIDANPPETQAPPGFFLFPEKLLPGGCGKAGLEKLDVALEGLFTAAGWSPARTDVRQAQQMYRALTPEMCLRSMGVYPARGQHLRLALGDIRTPGQLTTLLQRVGWNGHYPLVETIASQLEERNIANIAVHLDTSQGSIGSHLGLNCMVKKNNWLVSEDTKFQARLFDALRALDCTAEEKLSALAQLPRDKETLLMKHGAYTFVRGLSHIKLILTGERIEETKAYIYMWLIASSKPRG